MSGGSSARPHVVIAIHLDQPDLAELSFPDDLVIGLDKMRRAAALQADLHDAIVLRAAWSIASPSMMSRLIGFWQYTSAPDSTAAIITSGCQ